MPRETLEYRDGTRFQAFVCGRGIKQCAFCPKIGKWQCDVFVTPPGSRPRRRCNEHLCDDHRTNLVPPKLVSGEPKGGKDACPDHAPRAVEALARHRLALGAGD